MADEEALTVRGRRVVLGDTVTEAAIHIENGRIVAITEHGDTVGDVVDAGDLVVLPGLVDPHVHVNEPGRTEWEGFASATRAAAAGGTTTIVDMPLNCIPPTTTAEHLHVKQRAAEGRCTVDVGFWGGIVPDNADDLPALLDAGVLGCKAFLIDSGVEEFPPVDAERLRQAMPRLADAGVPLLVHAELADAMADAQERFASDTTDRRSHEAYTGSRPSSAEVAAVELVIGLVEATGAAAHILHLSAAAAVPVIRSAQERGLPVTAETCPHYLLLTSDDVPDGATEFKCAPPIRDRSNRDALWEAVAEGVVGMIASDHSPCTPELKQGDFATAWGGIASLQLRLPLTWTAAAERGHGFADLARWLAAAPAELAGLSRKGRIDVGGDADLVLFDPEAEWTVDADRLEHRHAVSPYDGMRLRGRVHATFLRGRQVFDGTAVDEGHGRFLTRRTTGGSEA